MAVDHRTLRYLRGMRIEIDTIVRAEVVQLLRAWGAAWDELVTAWDDAINDLVAASAGGRWPSRTKIARAERARRALELTSRMIDDLARDFNVRILSEVQTLTGVAAEWEARLIAAQIPDRADAGTQAELVARFNRIDPAALDAIVERTTGRIESLTRPLSDQAVSAMRGALIRGVAIGDNPRRVASDMLARVRGAFDGGRNRALVIARTEMLDASRAAAMAQDLASADVLRGWQWVATLDTRTCPSCWAMHGTNHAITDPGPLDHQQGRCSRLPRTKTWRELGFDIDEPDDLLPNARDVFDGLPERDQVQILGRRKLQMLNDEQIEWGDLAKRRSTTGWRDSYAPATLRDLIRKANT